MELFNFDKNQVTVRPHTLLIKEFKLIWDRDKSKNKEFALQELAYVFYIADYKSIYLSTAPEERSAILIDDLNLKNWKPDSVIEDAIKKYADLQKTMSMRFLDSQRQALEQLMLYFKNIKYENISKPSELSKSMTDTAKILESIDKIEERIRKELSSKGKTMGDREIGLFEDPEPNE